MQSTMEKKAGVHTYAAQWPIYSIGWTHRQDKRPRVAIGSFREEYSNKVELVQFSPDTSDFTTDHRLIFDHPYAATCLMFLPSDSPSHPDLLATSGEYVRLWRIHDDHIELRSLFNCNKASDFSSPITSFDWAHFDLRRIVAASVDTTCTVWDTEREAIDTQLVAHEKEVYDISWGGYNVFASVSGDGSVRVFDLRNKERSTIIYENNVQDCPLLRLEWNKTDPRFVAAVGIDSRKVVILDVRYPTMPLLELARHKGSVNAITWAPAIGGRICSVSDDARAFIWDVSAAEGGARELDPQMEYASTAEINNARWSPVELDSLAIVFLNKLQILRV